METHIDVEFVCMDNVSVATFETIQGNCLMLYSLVLPFLKYRQVLVMFLLLFMSTLEPCVLSSSSVPISGALTSHAINNVLEVGAVQCSTFNLSMQPRYPD